MTPGDAEALYQRGHQLASEGDIGGAERAWHSASQASHHGAALALGELKYQAGDPERAADEWAFAAGSESREIAVRAIVRYGRLISETEFSQTTVVGHHRNAKLLGGRDSPEAGRLWRLAAESDDPDAAWGWVGLGRLHDPGELAEEPDFGKSEAAFEEAVGSGHPDAAPYALMKLGRLRRETDRGREGPSSRAVEALTRGAESGHPEWAPRCAFHLGALYADAGDKGRAERWWRAAADSRHPDISEVATRALTDRSSPMRAGIRAHSVLGRLFGR